MALTVNAVYCGGGHPCRPNRGRRGRIAGRFAARRHEGRRQGGLNGGHVVLARGGSGRGGFARLPQRDHAAVGNAGDDKASAASTTPRRSPPRGSRRRAGSRVGRRAQPQQRLKLHDRRQNPQQQVFDKEAARHRGEKPGLHGNDEAAAAARRFVQRRACVVKRTRRSRAPSRPPRYPFSGKHLSGPRSGKRSDAYAAVGPRATRDCAAARPGLSGSRSRSVSICERRPPVRPLPSSSG